MPTTACEEIESAPSLIALQFAPSDAVGAIEVVGSRGGGGGVVVQVTATLVTSAAAIVPVPLATLQVWPLGLVLTVTV